MLTLKQRSRVIRVLTKAYYHHRDLPLLKVCKKNHIILEQQKDDSYNGRMIPVGQRVARLVSEGKLKEKIHLVGIEIPKSAPPDYKEFVFWHEFAHIWLERLHIFHRKMGFPGYLQQYDKGEDYWIHERLCDAFASAMLLYRRGLLMRPRPNIEAFLFADQYSLGYTAVARFSVERIKWWCKEAEAKGRNVDTRSLKLMLEHEKPVLGHNLFQPLLPIRLHDTHQTPWVSYTDERKDLDHNERHYGKDSWKWTSPWEQKLLAEINALKDAHEHEQFALFEETARADRSAFEARLERLKKAMAKYQKPNPAS